MGGAMGMDSAVSARRAQADDHSTQFAHYLPLGFAVPNEMVPKSPSIPLWKSLLLPLEKGVGGIFRITNASIMFLWSVFDDITANERELTLMLYVFHWRLLALIRGFYERYRTGIPSRAFVV